MKVSHKYSIYLDRRQSDVFIDVMQGDTYTREVEFSLYSGGVAWPVPSTASVAVVYSGPGGKGIYDTLPDGSTACNVDNNIVTATLVPQIMSIAGRTRVSLLFADEEGRQLATFTVIVRVLENPSECAGTPGDYVNIMHWTQSAISALAADFSNRLDKYAEALTQNFCYVAEDDGDGNVTLRPFHLGGFTDETLSKTGVPADAARVGAEVEKLGQRIDNCTPAGFGLGGFFSKVYSFEEADNLKVPGWYLVDAGSQRAVNGETMEGIQVVRVDGTNLDGATCRQAWIEDGMHPNLYRRYSSYSQIWGPFYSVTPSNIPGRVYRTEEMFNFHPVSCVLHHLGTINPGEYAEQELSFDEPMVVVDLVPSGRYLVSEEDMPGGRPHFTFYGRSGLRATVSASPILDDINGDMEVDTIVGYSSYLTVHNDTNWPLDVYCMVKFLDGFADWEWAET